MKRTLFILSLPSILFASCTTSEKYTEESILASESTNYAAEICTGETLVSKSAYVSCHNKTNKITGPAYLEIATKIRNYGKEHRIVG